MADIFQKTNAAYPLNGSSIDEISRAVQKQLTVLKYEKKNRNRIRLLVEEALLGWKNKFGEEKICTFTLGKRFRKPYILLETEGERFNPLEKENEALGEWGQHLLDGLGFHPVYSYANEKNALRFELKAPKPGSVVMILFAVLAAAVFGLLGNLMPEELRATITAEVLDRLSGAFYGMLGAVAGPLVFLSVLTAICGIGDTATLGTMGKTVITSYSLITFFPALISGLALPFIFGLSFGVSSGEGGISDMADMLFGIIPGDLVSPFQSGNSLQIIVLAVAFGIAALIIGKKVSGVVGIAEQLSSVTQLMMSWIGSLIPYLIFILVLQNLWSGSFIVLLQAWKPFVISLALFVLMFILFLVTTALRYKIPMRILFKSIFPSMLIGLTTASALATLSESVSGAEHNFGVRKKLADFSLPISTIICMPTQAISITALVLYSMKAYNMELSAASVALMIISVTLLLIAAPPVPGGVLSCYAVLFAQFGIPTAAMAVVITLDAFLDFFNTSIGAGIRQLALLAQADKLQMIDKSKLQSLS